MKHIRRYCSSFIIILLLLFPMASYAKVNFDLGVNILGGYNNRSVDSINSYLSTNGLNTLNKDAAKIGSEVTIHVNQFLIYFQLFDVVGTSTTSGSTVVDVNSAKTNLGLGYEFFIFDNFSIAPVIGLGNSKDSIDIYDNSSASFTNALNGVSKSIEIQSQAFSLFSDLRFTYQYQLSNNRVLYSEKIWLIMGVQLGYLKAFKFREWTSGSSIDNFGMKKGRELTDGPEMISSGFNIHAFLGAKIRFATE